MEERLTTTERPQVDQLQTDPQHQTPQIHPYLQDFREVLDDWKDIYNGTATFLDVMYAAGRVMGAFYAGKIPREQLPAGEDFLYEDRVLADALAEDARQCADGRLSPGRIMFILGADAGRA